MKLSAKIIIAQLLVTVSVLVIGLMTIPEIIYRSFSDDVRSDVASYSLQITDNISQRLRDIKRVTNVLAEDTTLRNMIKAYMENPDHARSASISLYLSGFYLRESLDSYKVLGIYISMDTEENSLSTVGLSEGVAAYLEENVIPEVRETDSGAVIVSPFAYENDSPTLFANDFDKLYGYSLRYKAGSEKGVITVVSPYSDISSLLSGVKDFARDWVLLDGSNQMINASLENTRIDIEDALNNLSYGSSYQIGYRDDPDGFSVAAFTTQGNWKLICRLSRQDIIERNGSIFRFVVILLVIFELLANLITILVVNRVLRPLREVTGKMHRVADGDVNVRIAYRGHDEIGEVVSSFNTMTAKLENNIQKLIEKEKTEQKLKYGILISKVDPHFIYNTMNTITYLAEKGRSQDVVIVNRAMIDIMKDRLRIELADVFDTVDQEIRVLKQYYTIQQYRFEGVFKYTIEVQEGMGSYLIAKSILQPIAENALLHGILTNTDEDGEMLGGCVSLTVRKITIDSKDKLCICVRDNGSGMTEEQLEEIRHIMTKDIVKNTMQRGMPGKERGRHVGLRNIRDRLQILYEGEADMSIESQLWVGTTVTITVPLMKENDFQN